MKTQIPDDLKDDMPHTWWGKILSATPVVLTVVATMLAGLSSSEMTRAQYDRSLAAQQQSKAGDQWNFFQGKKLRGAVQRSTLDGLLAAGDGQGLDETALRSALSGSPVAALLDTPEGRSAWTHALKATWPAVEASALPADLMTALQAIEESRPDAELNALVTSIDEATVESALQTARAQTLALDAATGSVSKVIDAVEKGLAQSVSAVSSYRAIIRQRLLFHSQRYDAEARVNQSIALLYEVQVRKSNLSAERHHRRSQRFFYGMLAAQMGVILSTLAMAARKRNLLWSIAAIAGVIAITFAIYVYLYV